MQMLLAQPFSWVEPVDPFGRKKTSAKSSYLEMVPMQECQPSNCFHISISRLSVQMRGSS
ncbi:hypothetical protein BOMU111920_14475 [Bordetella muralis]